MTDYLFDLAVMSGVLAASVTFLVVLGFVRLAFGVRGLIGHLAAGVVIVHGAVFLRTVYRDLGPAVVPWAVRDALYSPVVVFAMTTIVNALVFWAGLRSLRALQLAIPDEDRGRYTMLTAAFYPPWRGQGGGNRDGG